ncbi:cupin domain-containing protein [Parasphingorhabdus sp.]|uniref:cupin domain-containing protein n=1 Tax=Parasphingorhabdus sp. TaxID=2709688 RepID=UPI003263021F
MQLKNFDPDIFLRDYWQKKPMMICNPWEVWSNPLEPDELAGLACEEQIESRLITQSGDTLSVENGPIPESRFGKIGERQWTLLVQAVDQVLPDVAALIEPFRFIPNWRIDDVMVSYAADGGGVGPHFDQYDVFLIQGSGRRRWQIGDACNSETRLLPHDDLRLLAEFEPTDEWICEPGDILYVPPGISHNGVAVGEDCMTYSIGFRAPSRRELIGNWGDEIIDNLSDDDRYEDPDLSRQENPGEITEQAIARLHDLVLEKISDRDAFVHWFGKFETIAKYPEQNWAPEEMMDSSAVRNKINAENLIRRNPASRFSFVRRDAHTLTLFVDGEAHICADDMVVFAEELCARDLVAIGQKSTASEALLALIAHLYNRGCVTFEDGNS